MTIPEWIIVIIHLILLFIELTVVIFLLRQWFKPKSIFFSAYFIILNIGYCFDLLFAIGWIYVHFQGYPLGTTWMPIILYSQWAVVLIQGAWDFILALNRSMSLMFPMAYTKFWNPKTSVLWLLLLLFYPFIVDAYSFTNLPCKFYDYYEVRCIEFQVYEATLIAIVNTVCGVLSLALITLGVWKSPKFQGIQTEKTALERRLVLQTFIASTMLILSVMANYCFSYLQAEEFLLMVYAFYLIQFYPAILVLFYASTSFRNEFLAFYRIKENPENSRSRVIVISSGKSFGTVHVAK